MRPARPLTVLAGLVLLLAACGGADEPSDDTAQVDETTTTAEEFDATEPPATTTTTSAPVAEAAVGVDGGPGDFTPADRTFRIVNLSDDSFDVYGFTTGLVREYELLLGVEPGEVTDRLAPPADGKLVLFEAGATDVTGFDNPANLAEFSAAAFAERGTDHTIVLSTEVETGDLDTFELWENPDPGRTEANALPPAVDGVGTLLLMAVPRDGDSFKPSRPGQDDGCLVPRDPDQSGFFAGGTVILPFDLEPGAVELDLHSFDAGDLDCTGEPALAAVPFTPEAGVRTLVIVHRAGDLSVRWLPLR